MHFVAIDEVATFESSKRHTFDGTYHNAGGEYEGDARVNVDEAAQEGVCVRGFVMSWDNRKFAFEPKIVPIVDGCIRFQTTVESLGQVDIVIDGTGFTGEFTSGALIESGDEQSWLINSDDQP